MSPNKGLGVCGCSWDGVELGRVCDGSVPAAADPVKDLGGTRGKEAGNEENRKGVHDDGEEEPWESLDVLLSGAVFGTPPKTGSGAVAVPSSCCPVDAAVNER